MSVGIVPTQYTTHRHTLYSFTGVSALIQELFANKFPLAVYSTVFSQNLTKRASNVYNIITFVLVKKVTPHQF